MEITRLSRLALNQEGFAFDPLTGNSYVANGTGALVLEALRTGQSPSEIALSLTQGYEVSLEQAAQDVGEMIEQLKYLKLL